MVMNCHSKYYDNITIVDNDPLDTLTATIAAGSIEPGITRNNYPVLLELDYLTNGQAAVQKLGANWKGLYVKEGSTNLIVFVDNWDVENEACRLWVIVPTLTSNEKILTIELQV